MKETVKAQRIYITMVIDLTKTVNLEHIQGFSYCFLIHVVKPF